MSDITYKKLISKIKSSKSFSKNEKAVIIEAVDNMFSKYAIGANGIVSLIKITADKKTLDKFKEIIQRAKKRRESGKKALNEKDKRLLKKVLAYLRDESANKVSNAIQNGDYLFLTMLSKKMEKIDLEEMQKLQKIIEKL